MHSSEYDPATMVGVREEAGGKRGLLFIGPLEPIDGTDRLVPTVLGMPEGMDLELTDAQGRELYTKLRLIFEHRDKQK